MSLPREHELVPSIRDWLTATAGFSVPVGPSREEALREASELLIRISAGEVVSGEGLDSDSVDLFWAIVEYLERTPQGAGTFDLCDRVYQHLSLATIENDYFGERAELLHRISLIGWQSAPGGLEAILSARAVVWANGDEASLRAMRQSAHGLEVRIANLQDDPASAVSRALDLCSRLFRLGQIHPGQTSANGKALSSWLASARIGRLDDTAFLSGVASLAIGFSNRILGNWDEAAIAYDNAEEAFRRSCSRQDVERVRVERLAMLHARLDYAGVVEAARSLEPLAIPRDRIKAKLVLASSLIELGRPDEAIEILAPIAKGQELDSREEPVLSIYASIRLGSGYSRLGNASAAAESFAGAFSLLAKAPHLAQLGNLVACMGEGFGLEGRLEEAAKVYAAAREIFHQAEQPHLAAYLTVLLAEILMLTGRDREARAEILGVLPLMRERGLRKEAYSAIALLCEASLRNRPDAKTIAELREHVRRELR